MAEYLSDSHRKNSEAVKEYLRKQPQLSQEEMEKQTKEIHNRINQREQQSKNSK